MMASILDKINVLMIVREHVATLKDHGSPKYKPGDIVLFYVVPGGATFALAAFNVALSHGSISILMTALSIIVGLLFNLLVLLHSLPWRETRQPLAGRLRLFLGELHSNIAYAIVVALLAMIPLVIASNYQDTNRYVMRSAATWAAWYLVIHFALTMWMVLKRMYIALQLRLEDPL